ncbi:hypothetical protein [Chondromyces apiculatus]|nr:hypothetical protein [Chondromyces apiculatus]
MASLHAALEKAVADKRRVYACAEVFEEAVEVPAGVTLFGGLDCDAGGVWRDGLKTTVQGPADVPALRLLAGAERSTTLDDFVIRAPDAVTPGASSIGVLAAEVSATLTRCEVVAGNGAAGAAGAPGAEPAMPGDPIPQAAGGAAGNAGVNACSGTLGPNATLAGGAQVTSTCEGQDMSIGGKGGDGAVTMGMDGEAGVVGTLGEPGTGEPATGTGWACIPEGGFANPGSPGTDGEPGLGGTGLGTLSPDAGYVGVSGSSGTAGKPGQGGGGGGGAKGLANCGGNMPGAGASGGSGGGGGCGGKPGQGGGAGGSSIALVSVNAQLTLNACTLQAGNGGNGGAGGDLQAGGAGGDGGDGGESVGLANDACDGGNGGKGGRGGPGGGGSGGHAFSIAYRGTAVVTSGDGRLLQGTAGVGGPGGDADAALNSGSAGFTVNEQEFP